MKTSSKSSRTKSVKKVSKAGDCADPVSKHIDAAVKALMDAVSEDPSSEKEFRDYERAALEISNEICRRVLSKRLEKISHQNESDFFFNKRK
jgi:hypothetical protein